MPGQDVWGRRQRGYKQLRPISYSFRQEWQDQLGNLEEWGGQVMTKSKEFS